MTYAIAGHTYESLNDLTVSSKDDKNKTLQTKKPRGDIQIVKVYGTR